MLPTFPKLGFVWVKKTNHYKVGDIVDLLTLDKLHHCHRITEINSEWVSAKGDNLDQQWYEIKVPIRNLKGKITWSWPKN